MLAQRREILAVGKTQGVLKPNRLHHLHSGDLMGADRVADAGNIGHDPLILPSHQALQARKVVGHGLPIDALVILANKGLHGIALAHRHALSVQVTESGRADTLAHHQHRRDLDIGRREGQVRRALWRGAQG